jgi:CRP-like cAMP-binding protein
MPASTSAPVARPAPLPRLRSEPALFGALPSCGEWRRQGMRMNSPLVIKLEQFRRLPDEDRQLLNELTSKRRKGFGAREDIVREGEHSPDIHVVISGLVCRYKVLENGSRQIMAFLIAGDPCDAEIFILKEMDHSIGTLAPSVIASIPGDTMQDLLLNRPGIALAFWWNTLQDEGVLRERIIDEGRRDA